PVVPPGARDLTLTVATEFFDVPVPRIDAILRDGYGVQRVVSLEAAESGADPRYPGDPTRAETTYTAALPPALEHVAAEVRVVAFDVGIPPAAVADGAFGTLELRGLAAATAGGAVDLPLEAPWIADAGIQTSSPPLSLK